jgi:hypothetical protein
MAVLTLDIKTTFWKKPIPPRSFDWEAWLDNYEPGHAIGHGATEREAIDDLLSQIELEEWSE